VVTSSFQGSLCMTLLIHEHLLDNSAALGVIFGQFMQVSLQMITDLIFGGSYKA
jgi:hypothetical protein